MTEDKNSKDIKKIIGENVKHLRKSKKISQTDLMEVLDYRQESSISKIENGHSDISISILEKICNHFDVPISFICEKHNWETCNIDTAIRERVDAERGKDITKAAVLINNTLANLVPKSYQEKFAIEIYNILKPDKKT